MIKALEKDHVFTIELYEAHLPDRTLYLAATDRDITFNNTTYIAVPVSRGEITRGVDTTTDTCELSVSNATEYFTQMLFQGVNFLGSRVYVYQISYPDSLDNPNLVKPVFYGIIDAPELTEDGVFKVQLVSEMPSMQGGRVLMKPCNCVFGDEVCGKAVETTGGQIISANGSKLVGSTFRQDNKWKNSILLINGEGRRVVGMNGNEYTVEYPFLQNVVGRIYTLKQDCDKTQADCDRYNNRHRYAGFPSVPFEYQIKT